MALQFVPDAIARLLKKVVDPIPKAHLQFVNIPGTTTEATVPTRHGDVACTLYWPAPSGSVRPAVPAMPAVVVSRSWPPGPEWWS